VRLHAAASRRPCSDDALRPKTRRVPGAGLEPALLARIYEVFPLRCPGFGRDMRVLAFITDPFTLRQILEHLGLAARPPPLAPARPPPQPELELDQTPTFDPTERTSPRVRLRSVRPRRLRLPGTPVLPVLRRTHSVTYPNAHSCIHAAGADIGSLSAPIRPGLVLRHPHHRPRSPLGDPLDRFSSPPFLPSQGHASPFGSPIL
jgi:hypothetical protein